MREGGADRAHAPPRGVVRFWFLAVGTLVVSLDNIIATTRPGLSLDTAIVADTMSDSTLRLYRHILKAAKTFPSKNRAGLIEEIKTEFRENAGATDAGDVQKKLALARDGLDRMRAFTGLDQGASKWDVSLKGPYDGT